MAHEHFNSYLWSDFKQEIMKRHHVNVTINLSGGGQLMLSDVLVDWVDDLRDHANRAINRRMKAEEELARVERDYKEYRREAFISDCVWVFCIVFLFGALIVLH